MLVVRFMLIISFIFPLVTKTGIGVHTVSNVYSKIWTCKQYRS